MIVNNNANNAKPTIKKQRSFSEIVAVYQKLTKFYAYNFFLKKTSYLLVLFFLLTIIVPLSINIWIRWNSSLLGSWIFNDKNYHLILIFSLSNTIFFLAHRVAFLSFIEPTLSRMFLYFSGRSSKKQISPQEETIISSVKNIRDYDIFIFESLSILVIHSFHFISLLLVTSFYPSMNSVFSNEKLKTFRDIAINDPITNGWKNKDFQNLAILLLTDSIEGTSENTFLKPGWKEDIRDSFVWYFSFLSGQNTLANTCLWVASLYQFSDFFTSSLSELRSLTGLKIFDFSVTKLVVARISLISISLIIVFHSIFSKTKKLRD